MSYKIIVDSCGELTEAMKKDGHFETASLSIQVDEYNIIDDATFDQADFLKKVAASPNCPKSSCPSPEKYMEGYNCKEDNVYAVTLSSELSGSYNSAILGKNLYHEEHGNKNIYVFNSRAASTSQTLIAMKIQECENVGMSFEEVVEKVEDYIKGQTTYFVLESLEALRKNGRLTGIKAFVASALNIKPVMSADKQGVIIQLGQARGMKKALVKMVDHIINDLVNSEEKILAISHCNCKERAENVKKMIEERAKLKDIIINDTAGISSLYASDGGIIVTV
ncbi:MAG: DegV family protein [Lachnospiraceae bacterium]|nr:DegV family protein [Lachnospiraceae bacterium]